MDGWMSYQGEWWMDGWIDELPRRMVDGRMDG